MTISTTLLFSRAVDLMGKQQTALGQLQEKIATGKELVRPSDSPDLAVNISRIKSTIGQMDAFKNSLNTVNDRLRIEESYIEGAKDVLIKMKQLTISGANATMSGRDREVLALELDELTAEMRNLANGTDANGNFLFAGSRVATMPYSEDAEGVIRYQGDTFRPNMDYTANRRSPIGRNGPDIFKPVLSGEQIPPTPGVYSVALTGSFESGDVYQISIDGRAFEQQVAPGDTQAQVLTQLKYQIDDAVERGELSELSVDVGVDYLSITALDGIAREIVVGTANTSDAVSDLATTIQTDSQTTRQTLSLAGTMEPGDELEIAIGSRSFRYAITGREGEAPLQVDDVLAAFANAANASGLFAQSAEIQVDPNTVNALTVIPLRDSIGTVAWQAIERTAINDQGMAVSTVQEPTPAIAERVEFFESLQEVAELLRNGTQEQIQGKLDHLDQMLDIVTLSLADIGSEMSSIADEISINEDLKLQLETTLSSQEDLDLTTAITDLQAKMMSLEAAQSSFAKISQLTIFDYLR